MYHDMIQVGEIVIIDLNRETNRDKASNEEIFELCNRIWADEMLQKAFQRVGIHGYFEMDEYLKIHKLVTDYWQEGDGNIYLGDLFMVEAILRRFTAGQFPAIDSEESREFIKNHRPHRHGDGSLMQAAAVSVDEVIEFIEDLRQMPNIQEFCENSKKAFSGDDREKIEEMQLKESYLAERFRRKKGYMEKLGYIEAFNVMRDLLNGEFKQDINSERLKDRIGQSLQFWKY